MVCSSPLLNNNGIICVHWLLWTYTWRHNNLFVPGDIVYFFKLCKLCIFFTLSLGICPILDMQAVKTANFPHSITIILTAVWKAEMYMHQMLWKHKWKPFLILNCSDCVLLVAIHAFPNCCHACSSFVKY